MILKEEAFIDYLNKNVFNVKLTKGNSIVSVNRRGYTPVFACIYLTPTLIMGAKFNQNTQQFSEFFGYKKSEIKDLSIKASIFMNKIYITLVEKDSNGKNYVLTLNVNRLSCIKWHNENFSKVLSWIKKEDKNE